MEESGGLFARVRPELRVEIGGEGRNDGGE